jgi:hypothetical protein
MPSMSVLMCKRAPALGIRARYRYFRSQILNYLKWNQWRTVVPFPFSAKLPHLNHHFFCVPIAIEKLLFSALSNRSGVVPIHNPILMKPTITKASDSFQSVFQRLKLNQNYLSQWFLSRYNNFFEKPLMDGVNSFCTRDSKYSWSCLFSDFAKSELRVSLPEVSNALHFTDWSKELVSWLPSKEQK